MNIDKPKVKKILNSFSKIDKTKCVRADGNLDLQKFNELPEVKLMIKELKKLGVTKKYLWKHFIIAGMVLRI